MQSSAQFDKLYGVLNKEQKKAVDSIEGPVMVIAGPGTGKTTVLTLRIANILRVTDVHPGSVLALTFTESAVSSMRKKLLDIIGSSAYKVHIHTFHGFCNEVIQKYPENFPKIAGSVHITEVDQIRILRDIFEDNNFVSIKPYGSPFHYLRDALQSIRNLKRETISVEGFRSLIKKEEEKFELIPDKYYTSGQYEGKLKTAHRSLLKDIEKNYELLIVYETYEKALRKGRWYDFEDMILEVVKQLESNEDLRLQLQEQYLYLLADEHQDANFSQNRLLELLASYYHNPNLFIVGDEKQAIFRFQGASLDNFLYFKKQFREAQLINLTENYRSYQEILDSAHSLIRHTQADQTLRRSLHSAVGSSGTPVLIYEFTSPDMERQFIVSSIQDKIKQGVSPGEIAIIYRDNQDAFPIAGALGKTTIPFVIESSQNVLDDEDIGKLLLLLRTIDDIGNEENFAKALFLDFVDIDHIHIYALLQYAAKAKKNNLKVLRDRHLREKAGISDASDITIFLEKLLRWSTRAKNQSFLDIFEVLIRESGFLEYILKKQNSAQKLARLEQVFDEVRNAGARHRMFTLKDFLDHIDLILEHSITIKVKEDMSLVQSVHLMTGHRAKGLEFDHVYIIGTTDGHWGNRRVGELFTLPVPGLARIHENMIDDERRLFYVALTRARKEVAITFSAHNEEGRSAVRSQFIEEIQPEFKKEISTRALEKKLLHALPFHLREELPHGTKVTEKEFLNKLFLEEGLSVTALNNYLSCPWEYFFVNLIRIPKTASKFQRYGIAIHGALCRFFTLYVRNKRPSKKKLEMLFSMELERVALTDREYETLYAKGVRALAGYFETYKHSWHKNILLEFDITGIPFTVSAITLPLRGKLDKIEIQNDGKTVNVIDYKTSKPLTRAAIEGTIKTSNGDYKRQLVFYKLLLDTYAAGKYSMEEGILDFVEPDEKGRYKKESFKVTHADVELLKETLTRVITEIFNLDFWNKTCSNKECEYCKLAHSLKGGSL